MKGLQSFQVAAAERGLVYIWEEIDWTCWLCYNLVITHCLINTVQIENPKSRQEWNSHFSWSTVTEGAAACVRKTEKLLLSSVVCSGRTKGETFKRSNENQKPKSHWLLMKVRGRRFCCASETSSLNCQSCWWWMRSACATFWTPAGTKVTLSYVCCVAGAKHRSPLLVSMRNGQ